MPSRPVHAADREVIELCRERGLEMTARRLERMRPYLPRRHVRHLQGHRGTTSANPPDYVDHVIALAGVLSEGVTYREAPLVLFARRLPVDPEVLRAAYQNLLERQLDGLCGTTTLDTFDAEALHDLADAASRRLAKRRTPRAWRTRARQAIRQQEADANDVTSLLQDTWSAVLTWLITGEAASPAGTKEALMVFGLHDGHDLAQASDHLSGINLEALPEAVRTATWEQWSTAREDLDALHRYIDLRQRVDQHVPEDQRLPGLKDAKADDPVLHALQISVLLVLNATGQWRTGLGRHLANYESLERYLADLPPDLRNLIGEDAVSPDQSNAIQRHFQEWASRHPAHAQTLAEGLD